MGLSFFTWLLALRITRHPARLGALVFLSPVLSLVWISLVLGEPLGKLALPGMGAILTGVALTRRTES
jgi:drug/metabolite transporter (DMT)-like permease